MIILDSPALLLQLPLNLKLLPLPQHQLLMYRALHRIIRILQPAAFPTTATASLLDLHLRELPVVGVDLEVDRVDLLPQLLLPVLRLLPLLTRSLCQLPQLADHFVTV